LNRISFVGQELDNSSFLAQIHHWAIKTVLHYSCNDIITIS
jgi:hypothetical protein